MSIKKGSGVVIKPYYDGLLLSGMQDVAGDGLSVLSIKEKHNNCRFTVDPDSKHPVISCARGLKARNSFWNLLKPDLRKVRGLECSTTESVAHMFHKHNSSNAAKPSYKRRVMRLLESLVSNKPKSQERPQSLVQNEAASWPINKCVLAGICQEKEMKSNGIFQLGAEIPSNNHSISGNKSNIGTDFVDDTTDYITINETCTYTIETSKTDFAALETQKSEILTNVELLSGAIGVQLCNVESPPLEFDQIPDLLQEVNNTPSPQVFQQCCKEKSDTKLENECVETHEIEDGELVPPLIDYSNRPCTTKTLINSEDHSELQSQDVETSEDSSSKMVQSIFVEMFKEMQDIEDYINSYISSFCPLEEEFENHPMLDVPSERVLHFLEQVHSPTKVITSHDNKNVAHLKNDTDKNSESCTLEIKKHAKLHEHLEPVSSEVSECSRIFAKDGMKNEMEQLETVKSNDLSNKMNETGNALYHESCSTTHELDGKQHGYCYWEDSDAYDLKVESEVLVSEIPLSINNTSLINMEFFENIWKEITDTIDGDIAYRHEERLTSILPRDKIFIQEIQSTEPYDQCFIEEAENIKHTIDNFITNECFPCQNNDNYNPCSILEISNENFETVFLRENLNGSQSLKSLQNEEVLRESQTKYKISETEFQVFSYFQHLSENTSNLSLFPEDELKDSENISPRDSRERNTFLSSNERFITGKISEENLTDLESPVIMDDEEYYFDDNNISIAPFIEIADTETEQKVPQTNVSVPGFPDDTKSSVGPISLLDEIKIELAPSYSDLTFDVVSVGGVKIKHGLKTKINEEMCDAIQNTTISPSKYDPDILIKLENVVEIDEVANNTNDLQEQKINDNLFEDDISKNVLVTNSNEKFFTDFCLVEGTEVSSSDKAPENDISKSGSQANSADRSIFVQLPDDGTCQTNSQFIFSSNKVQLNLTNPVLNVNKK